MLMARASGRFFARSALASVALAAVQVANLFAQGVPGGASDCNCLLCRPTLTGGWYGARTRIESRGITLAADETQFYYGVASGGAQQQFRYGGHGDYVINTDFGKVGVQEGLFLKLRAEHRYGQGVVDATGALLPANVSANLPTPDSEALYLTNVLITQALSRSFAMFAGKMDTLDGDANAFASGRGKLQFSNVAFVANPLLLRTVPYSTLGAGVVVLRDLQPFMTFTVLNATDTAKTSGFGQLFEEGAVLVGEMRAPTRFFQMPGHQLVGGSWSSRHYVRLDQDPRIILPQVPIDRTSGSWSLYWNADQYLRAYSNAPLRGWGLFGRAGIADQQANPLGWFLSFGIGGDSPMRTRNADTFGAGWFYAGTSNQVGPFLQNVLGPIGDGQGIELYYKIAARRWLEITPDMQVLVPAPQTVDTALVVGIRARAIF